MYSLELMPEARDDLAGLDEAVAQRILDKLRWLAEYFDVHQHPSDSGDESIETLKH